MPDLQAAFEKDQKVKGYGSTEDAATNEKKGLLMDEKTKTNQIDALHEGYTYKLGRHDGIYAAILGGLMLFTLVIACTYGSLMGDDQWDAGPDGYDSMTPTAAPTAAAAPAPAKKKGGRRLLGTPAVAAAGSGRRLLTNPAAAAGAAVAAQSAADAQAASDQVNADIIAAAQAKTATPLHCNAHC